MVFLNILKWLFIVITLFIYAAFLLISLNFRIRITYNLKNVEIYLLIFKLKFKLFTTDYKNLEKAYKKNKNKELMKFIRKEKLFFLKKILEVVKKIDLLSTGLFFETMYYYELPEISLYLNSIYIFILTFINYLFKECKEPKFKITYSNEIFNVKGYIELKIIPYIFLVFILENIKEIYQKWRMYHDEQSSNSRTFKNIVKRA